MSYQVIARKWRPQKFEEVTGQEPITRTLSNALAHERLHHAYLFSGARGVGKTTTARLLAKGLNCHRSDRPTATPCVGDDPTECPSCREIAEGRSIDVLEIDAASNTGVDNVRDTIIGSVSISPARDRYKVFIIDEVHMLTTQAFNALLKTLEEPPPKVVFIMATTEKHKLPETILSRCQQFEFRTIPKAKIAERLRLIADSEKVEIGDEALNEIARAGEGSMRDAQSAFDQVISFVGSKVSAADVEAALGLASTQMLARAMNAVAEGNAAEALAIVNELVARGHDLRNFCRDLLGHVRDLLVARVSGEKTELLDTAAADRNDLKLQAMHFSESDLVRFFHSLTETESNLRIAAHPRYQLEVGLVKLMEMRRIVPLENLIARLEALEGGANTGSAPKAESPQPPGRGSSRASAAQNVSGDFSQRRTRTARDHAPDGATYMEAAEPSVAQPRADAASARSIPPPSLTLVGSGAQQGASSAAAAQPALDEQAPHRAPQADDRSIQGPDAEKLKAALEQRNRMFLVVAIEGARNVIIEGDELIVEYGPETRHLRDNLARPDNIKLMREVAREVFGRDLKLKTSLKEKGNGSETLTAADRARLEKKKLRELAEQQPAVQKMLRTFRAEIVDVTRLEDQ